jgi:hypothetical protein
MDYDTETIISDRCVVFVVRQTSPVCVQHKRFLPEQFPPLPPNAPELHMPVEHAVRTSKSGILAEAAKLKPFDERLTQAKSFQDWGNSVVSQKLSGPNGREHLQGSIRKLQFTSLIIASPEDTVLEVPDSLRHHHAGADEAGGHRRKRVKAVKTMNGTAGGQIADTFFN